MAVENFSTTGLARRGGVARDEMATLACGASQLVMGKFLAKRGEMMSEMMDQMSSLFSWRWATKKAELLRNGGAVPLIFFARILTAPFFIINSSFARWCQCRHSSTWPGHQCERGRGRERGRGPKTCILQHQCVRVARFHNAFPSQGLNTGSCAARVWHP